MSEARWSIPARLDLDRIAEHLEEFGEETANRVEREIIRKADWLTENQYTGAPLGTDELRKSIVVGTHFLIFYRPLNGTIEVARVRHMAENWQNA